MCAPVDAPARRVSRTLLKVDGVGEVGDDVGGDGDSDCVVGYGVGDVGGGEAGDG